MNPRPPGYEPGELPGCSTPRRGRQYTSVDVFFWAALGFLVAAIVVGTGYVSRHAYRAWKACVSLALVGAAGSEMLDAKSAATAAKLARVTAGGEQLLLAMASLERSRARARVLVGAVDEMLDVVRAVTSLVPKK